MAGGGGADSFHFRAAAETAGDSIADLRLIDADASTAGDQAFTWIGDAALEHDRSSLIDHAL